MKSLKQQIAILGILVGLVACVEIFAATANVESERQLFDAARQDRGQFSSELLINYIWDSLQQTLTMLFMAGIYWLYQPDASPIVKLPIQLGIGASYVMRLGGTLLGNYTSLFNEGSDSQLLFHTLELLTYQQWCWTTGFTLLGLAYLTWATPVIRWVSLAAGVSVILWGMSLASISAWSDITDLMRYTVIPVWATVCGAWLLLPTAPTQK